MAASPVGILLHLVRPPNSLLWGIVRRGSSQATKGKVWRAFSTQQLCQQQQQTPGDSKAVVDPRQTVYDCKNLQIINSKMGYIFDTHAAVKLLQDKGFTQDQAECLTHTMLLVTDVSMHYREKEAATKAQLEIMREQIMSHLASLKKDMIILEKSEFSMLRTENDKLKIELAQLRAQVKDDMSNLHTKMALDINLERSRAKEDHAEGQRSIGKLDTRVTGELGNLRTLFEQYKNDIYKISAGAVASCLTIILGFYRIWMWK